MDYYDYKDGTELVCSRCGWKGVRKEADNNLYDSFLDVRCPRVECDAPILTLVFPTLQETEQAYADGKEIDPLDLKVGRMREDMFQRWNESKLCLPEQLPELQEIDLEFVWDRIGESVFGRFYVIRLGDKIIWKEMAFYEDGHRFPEVIEIFKKKYGMRFKEMGVTWAALNGLMGDKLSYWHYVKGSPVIESDGRKRWDLTT